MVFFRFAVSFTLVTGTCLFCLSCLLRSAGTSTGTENPEIEISFIQDGDSAVVSGTLDIYEAGQIPVSNPSPIMRYSIVETSSFTVPVEDLEILFSSDQGLKKQSRSASTYDFNLVLKSQHQGGIVQGLRFDSQNRTVTFDGREIEKLFFSISPLSYYRGIIEEDFSGEYPIFLYIPGTPYKSDIRDKKFELENIPAAHSFKGRILTNSGRVYVLPDSIRSGDSIQISSVSLENSILMDTVSTLISTADWPIYSDTVFSSLWLSNFCTLKGHPNTLIYMQEDGLSGTLVPELITWSQLPEKEMLCSKKMVFSSYKDSSEGISFYEIENAREEDKCRHHGFQNENIRLDSAYIFSGDSWEISLRLYFTSLEIDSITVRTITIDTNNVPDTVVLFSFPRDTLPEFLSDSLHIWTWREDDRVWVDTLWYP
jgi:hypothetical protein